MRVEKVARILDSCKEQAFILEFAYIGSLEVRAGPATKIWIREDLPRVLGPAPTKTELMFTPIQFASFIHYGYRR